MSLHFLYLHLYFRLLAPFCEDARELQMLGEDLLTQECSEQLDAKFLVPLGQPESTSVLKPRVSDLGLLA